MNMRINLLFKQHKNVKILIVGAGISGKACAKWLSSFDCKIDLIDSRKIELENNLPENVTLHSECIFSAISF